MLRLEIAHVTRSPDGARGLPQAGRVRNPGSVDSPRDRSRIALPPALRAGVRSMRATTVEAGHAAA